MNSVTISSISLIRIRILVIVILWSILPSNVMSSTLTMDFCRFRGDSIYTNLEIYIDIPRDGVSMAPDSLGWYGALILNSEIRQNNKSGASDRWLIDFIDDNEQTVSSTQRVIDARIYQLPPGFYEILISARDSLSGTSWSAHDTITISERPENMLTISDIELASHIFPIKIRPKFSRGDFSLVPNPGRLFGANLLYFIYYIEIYPPLANLTNQDNSDITTHSSDREKDISFTMSRSILDGSQNSVGNYEDEINSGAIVGFADIDSIDISDLPTGAYQFNISITDENENHAVSSTRFYIYDKARPPLIYKPAINIMDLDEELAEINFLLTIGQRKLIRKMSPDEKQNFLVQFWRRYDDDLSTQVVPARTSFRKRVKIADDIFNTSRSPGHKTDRGRILILYGEPTAKEHFPLEMGAKPYEIWTYDQLEGGVFFAFVDRSGLGEAGLVHSTKKGETYNPRWMELYVYRTGVDARR